jgi:hypothetical protein
VIVSWLARSDYEFDSFIGRVDVYRYGNNLRWHRDEWIC